jgi:CBS domain
MALVGYARVSSVGQSRAAHTIHTRLPAYEGDLDHIIGILHLQDLFKHVRQPQAARELRSLVRPALFVPETIALDDLRHTFQQRPAQIALVIDEHGNMEGLVTLEDVVEEVFGEVHDALEAEQPSPQICMLSLEREGRSHRPRWVRIMAARRRKTLVVCQDCHHDIQYGRYDGPALSSKSHRRAT